MGVIGVAVALTLPSFINNYNKKVWVSQLKTNYTLLVNGFSEMTAKNGTITLAETETFLSLYGAGCGTTTQISSPRCDLFWANFKKYFKGNLVLLNDYKYSESLLTPNEKSKYTKTAYLLDNGAILFNYYINVPVDPSIRSKEGQFLIDVNGLKGPNVMGRDIFYFAIVLNPPYLVAAGSLQCGQIFCADWPYWKECRGCCKTDDYSPMSFRTSHNCAGRIIEEGWKMNY